MAEFRDLVAECALRELDLNIEQEAGKGLMIEVKKPPLGGDCGVSISVCGGNKVQVIAKIFQAIKVFEIPYSGASVKSRKKIDDNRVTYGTPSRECEDNFVASHKPHHNLCKQRKILMRLKQLRGGF